MPWLSARAKVADLESQRERWSDPAYITTQARERLYYTLPGEVVYLIDDDLPASATPGTTGRLARRRADAHRLDVAARAVGDLRRAAQVVVPSIGVPDPAPTPAPTP